MKLLIAIIRPEKLEAVQTPSPSAMFISSPSPTSAAAAGSAA